MLIMGCGDSIWLGLHIVRLRRSYHLLMRESETNFKEHWSGDNRSDEDIDPQHTYYTLESDNEADQLRTISQEEEPHIKSGMPSTRNFIHSSSGTTNPTWETQPRDNNPSSKKSFRGGGVVHQKWDAVDQAFHLQLQRGINPSPKKWPWDDNHHGKK
jgi:hypothetical protein